MKNISPIHFKNLLILVLIGIVILLTAVSSQLPDGLEWTTKKLGFKNNENNLFKSPFGEYSISNTFSPEINQVFSAILGGFLLATLIMVIMFWSRRKSTQK